MSSSTSEQKPVGCLRTVVELIIIAAIVLVASWVIRSFLIAPYEIPSGSMENTIEIADKIFSEKWTYWSQDPARGDIVTFTDPEDSGRTLIKRVVATGGQTVDLRDGTVYVDGTPLDEPYTEGRPSYPLSSTVADVTFPYTVPDGSLWVMGDNRTNSADSRYFGAIPKDSVSGKACCIYFPLDRIGGLS